MKNHLRNLQSGVAFCLCLVAVRKRIYGLRQTQNASPIVSREVAESIIEEIYINKEKRGNSNTMILNGDEVMKNTVHLQLSKERHIKKIKKRSFPQRHLIL